MLFSSTTFFAFFAIYFVFHLLTPQRYRVYLIILGSTVFYAWWKVQYVWLPFALTGIAYFGVQWIEGATEKIARKRRLTLTLILLFVPLVVYKYTDFLYGDVVGPVFGFGGSILDLALPLGVSFVTFTLTAYIVDIYRGKFPAKQSLTKLTAYVLFFPHLIAGPILRPGELMPQLDRPRPVLSPRFSVGFLIFTVGLVKKLVFADQIAGLVDLVYSKPGIPSATEALLAIYGFSVQIYCDFSGYTDMAIGMAILIGIRLPNNFLRPYFATSIVDFWRRWHITLSFWLRDYLYFGLGGNRQGAIRTFVNIVITMTLGGLWHGANWTFVIWGLLHGVGVSFVHFLRSLFGQRQLTAIPGWVGALITFHFVTLVWIFFRAPTVEKAMQMLAAPFVGGWSDAVALLSENRWAIVLFVVFFALYRFDDHRRVRLAVRSIRPEIIWPLAAVAWVMAVTISQGGSAQFIYFDF